MSRIGPYKILESLGEGGMGEVYRAEQTEPVQRRVALKIIKLGMDTRGRAVATEYDWPTLKPTPRDVAALRPRARERVVGSYRASRGDPGAEVTIRLAGNSLLVASTYWTGYRILYPASAAHFFTLEGDWEMDFQFDGPSSPARSVQFGPVTFDRIAR